jgi:hypothetical protein
MKVLYLLIDGPATAPKALIEAQGLEHAVETVDLAQPNVPYESVVEKIFAADRVISW